METESPRRALRVESPITDNDAPVSSSIVVGHPFSFTERVIGFDLEERVNMVYASVYASELGDDWSTR